MVNINDLLQTAKDENSFNDLSTLDLIQASGLQIQNNFGVTCDNFKDTEALLVWTIIDDSGSINGISGGPEAVCEGQNMLVDELTKFKNRKDILVGQSLLNSDTPIQPFTEVSNMERLELYKNYSPHGYTPLYRKCVEALSTMALKAKVEFLQEGFPCRCILCIVTDGRDEDHSGSHRQYTAGDVKTLIEELGEDLIVYFVGVGKETFFKNIAKDMGINEKTVLTTSATKDAIKNAFREISSSVSSASKSGAAFSTAATSGFTV